MNHKYSYLFFSLATTGSLLAMELPVARSLAQPSAERNISIAPLLNNQSTTDEILVNTDNKLKQALTLISDLSKKNENLVKQNEHLIRQKSVALHALIEQLAGDKGKTHIILGTLKNDSLFARELLAAGGITQPSAGRNTSVKPLSISQGIPTDEILINTDNELRRAMMLIDTIYKKNESLVKQNNLLRVQKDDPYQCFQEITHLDCLDKLDKTKLAQFLEQLGENFFLGQDDCEQNFDKARECFEKLEQLDISDYDKTLIWYYLGGIYELGINVERNLPLAMQYLHRIPHQNSLSPESEECLASFLESIGEKYFLGQNGCEQNYDKARTCFEKVEQLDIPEYDKTTTWYHLGAIYYCGHNSEKNLPLAKKYLLKIPNQNTLCRPDKKWLAYWLENIGDAYYFGDGTCKQNYDEARICFEKVEQLDAPGYDKTPTWYYLGAIHTLGLNVEINLARAKDYFLKIPDQNSLTPGPKQYLASWLKSIGEKYSAGKNGCEHNPSKARECFEKITRLQVPGYPRLDRPRD